jgi:hypothetical protein
LAEHPVYGGTRHSTVVALGEEFSPEEIRMATMHSTNKVFERYFRVKPELVKSIFTKAQKKGNYKGTQILPIKNK